MLFRSNVDDGCANNYDVYNVDDGCANNYDVNNYDVNNVDDGCSDYNDVNNVDDGCANNYDVYNVDDGCSIDDHRSVIWRRRSCSSSGRSSDCFLDNDLNLVNDDNFDDVDRAIDDDALVRRAGSFAWSVDPPAL